MPTLEEEFGSPAATALGIIQYFEQKRDQQQEQRQRESYLRGKWEDIKKDIKHFLSRNKGVLALATAVIVGGYTLIGLISKSVEEKGKKRKAEIVQMHDTYKALHQEDIPNNEKLNRLRVALAIETNYFLKKGTTTG